MQMSNEFMDQLKNSEDIREKEIELKNRGSKLGLKYEGNTVHTLIGLNLLSNE